MNICICTSSFPANRTEVYHRYVEDLIGVLRKNGHSVSILTQEKREHKENFIPGVDVTWFPWKMTEKKVLSEVAMNSFGNIRSALSLIKNGCRYANKIQKEKKIDLFVCLWIVPSGFYLYLKNIFFKKTPYILWSLGSDVYNNKDNFFTRFILKKIIRGSKAVFADGFELCEIIRNISGCKCEFLPTFHKIEKPSLASPASNKETNFLFIGRLSHVKGADLLIEALKLIADTSFSCNIIGDGEQLQTLKAEVAKNKLQEKVRFLGKITDEKEKEKYFSQADCIIIPSRSESIPVVLSEAVQYNKPMITTNAGDMELLVKKYRLGTAVQKENPIVLGEAIRKFVSNPTQIDPKNRETILDELLFENSSNKLLMLLT